MSQNPFNWQPTSLPGICAAQHRVVLREDHVTGCICDVTFRATGELIHCRLLLEGVTVSETEITPPFGVCRESLRVLHRRLKTGELAFKIAVSAWSLFGSDGREFFHHHGPVRKCPGPFPLPPGRRIDINVMKLRKGSLPIIKVIRSDGSADINPLPIYISAKCN